MPLPVIGQRVGMEGGELEPKVAETTWGHLQRLHGSQTKRELWSVRAGMEKVDRTSRRKSNEGRLRVVMRLATCRLCPVADILEM